MGKILFVPTIIYPNKKKRVVMHHQTSYVNYMNSMLHRQTVPYFKMLAANPYYKDILAQNPYYKDLQEDVNFKEGMKAFKYP